MALPVYSLLLWEQGMTSGSTFESDPVPAGYVWIVRDIDAFAPGPPFTPLGGLYFRDDAGVTFASFPNGYAYGGEQCEWRGRQVLNAGDHIHAQQLEEWQWRISGYQLSLP